MITTCHICANDTKNPFVTITNGFCQTCTNYFKSPVHLTKEKVWFFQNNKAILGMSGGKDSTATAYMMKKFGWDIQGFTFDSGYYPKHTPIAAKEWADKLEIPHKVIDIRQYISPELRQCYRLTADLFDKPLELEEVKKLYSLGRQHYSVKDKTVMPFLRGCQLCRKMVIPAYYEEALKHNVNIVILGMNEWTHLTNMSEISAIRRLKPDHRPEVFVIHLPFLLRMDLERTQKILKDLNWTPPRNESLVETNGNSCCLARATQKPFFDCLGFHPDTTRLSREITCGFVARQDVTPKLKEAREYNRTVRQVLTDADII